MIRSFAPPGLREMAGKRKRQMMREPATRPPARASMTRRGLIGGAFAARSAGFDRRCPARAGAGERAILAAAVAVPGGRARPGDIEHDDRLSLRQAPPRLCRQSEQSGRGHGPRRANPWRTIVRATAADPARVGVFNNAAQHWNHSFFWRCMKPDGGGAPGGELAQRIWTAISAVSIS